GQFHAIAKDLSGGERYLTMPGTADPCPDDCPVNGCRGAGDDVDDGEHGVGAGDRRARSTDDLDPFDGREIQREFVTDRRAAPGLLVDDVSINEQEDAVVVVGWTTEAACAEIGVVAIIREVESADAL